MILTNELLGMIARKRLTQADVAQAIGVTPKTFYNKMKKGVFGSDEIEKMIRLLDIAEPDKIFLQKKYLDKLLT